MRIAGIVGGIVLAFAGAVWLLQGLGSQFVPQSFMTNSGLWVVIGTVAVIAGVVMVRANWRKR